ncbi:MAG TPA: SMP-30/gluconolactonase/LRE family protein [Terriglobia bacterium]|nr:SMP-30/gluconolactonase/LRE family protein [Terriglobia bacterium]
MKRREFLKSTARAGLTVRSAGYALGAPPILQSNGPKRSADLAFARWPDSEFHPGVPKGDVFNFQVKNSSRFNGSERTINVYVPAQYTGRKPACVLIVFDGLEGFHVPAVFDNLIHKAEMPVTIGIGFNSGETPSSLPSQNPRFNRSFEFDSMTSVLADFVLDELLPQIERQKTPDGLPIMLSGNANDRGVAGCSSGGIAALNVAWRRPDAFRRVYIASGTFVGMRAGDRYPVLIRKTEPKPLRVFINDGDKDEWWGGPEFGDWWVSNQDVERALTFAGYDVNHVWGLGAHCQQAASVFPLAMRWLWRDWPKPVVAGQTGNFNLTAILKPDEEWRRVVEFPSHSDVPQFQGYFSPPVVNAQSTAVAIASDHEGTVFVQNVADGTIYRIAGDDHAEPFAKVSPGDNGLAFGADGRLYVAETYRSRILAFDGNGNAAVVARELRGYRLTVTHSGSIYVTEAIGANAYSGKIWLVTQNGAKAVVAEGLNGPSGLSTTPDGLWLFVGESKGHYAYSYAIQPNGELRSGEPFYWCHTPASANDSGLGQVCMDREGRAYAASRLGVQVFDRNGRVTAILPVDEGLQLAGICFGGSDLRTIYVSTGTSVYRRELKAEGVRPWAPPVTLPPWSAG